MGQLQAQIRSHIFSAMDEDGPASAARDGGGAASASGSMRPADRRRAAGDRRTPRRGGCALPGAYQEGGDLSTQHYLLDELVLEWLEWSGCTKAASVFAPEANLPSERLPRGVLADRLGLRTGPRSEPLPLLYALAAVARRPDVPPTTEPAEPAGPPGVEKTRR